MSKETTRWKNAEKQAAEIFNKYKIKATRISRAGNYSVSIHDVSLDDFPNYKLDSKYSVKGFATNRLLETVRSKYCKESKDIPILLTKGYREQGMKITVDADFFAKLLSYWLGCATKEELND